MEQYHLALIHGWGSPVGLRRRILASFERPYPGIIVFGHSHTPEKVMEDGILWVNPGSAVYNKTPEHKTVAIVTLNPGGVTVDDVQIVSV